MTNKERISARIHFVGCEYRLKILYLYRVKNLTARQTAENIEREYGRKLEQTTIRTYVNKDDTPSHREYAVEVFEPKPKEDKKPKTKPREKEYLYVGHYVDIKGRYILKIGTTNDLDRRGKEHTYNYRKAKQYTMPKDETFHYDWHLKLSKYNTLRFEDVNREIWRHMGIGHFIRNDRFICAENPGMVTVTIKKTYFVNLGGA